MTLTPAYLLTTEHAACRGGQPVLLHRTTGTTYEPADLLAARPSQVPLTAAAFVRRMTQAMTLEPHEAEVVARFCALGV